ncbi:hypothetical protein DRQ33_00260 [bacterium]|nr:MAG: hypothetical protein DRQ33_00260 [bacterium]
MKRIVTDKAPTPVGPYSQAIISNGLVYTAGQIALTPKSKELVGEDITSQTEQVINNLSQILESAGSNLSRVIRCDVFLADLDHFDEFNRVYEKYFNKSRPARITVEVGSLPKSALVEIAVIAEVI